MSIFPIRKMEGTKLHPVREARGWLFDPAEVAELKLTRTAPRAAAPSMSEGRVAARVFYLFDHGRELREIVEELEVPPGIVRELSHEWMPDLQEGELERRKTTQEERRRVCAHPYRSTVSRPYDRKSSSHEIAGVTPERSQTTKLRASQNE